MYLYIIYLRKKKKTNIIVLTGIKSYGSEVTFSWNAVVLILQWINYHTTRIRSKKYLVRKVFEQKAQMSYIYISDTPTQYHISSIP